MPITREQALTEKLFHDQKCKNWRRNGQTQTWKTRPSHFRTPVKFGQYAYGQITHNNADQAHLPGDPGCVKPS